MEERKREEARFFGIFSTAPFVCSLCAICVLCLYGHYFFLCATPPPVEGCAEIAQVIAPTGGTARVMFIHTYIYLCIYTY